MSLSPANNADLVRTMTQRTAPLPEKNEEEKGSSIPPFAVHSVFRHKKTGQVLRPRGLQWNMPGKSHVTFVSLDPSQSAQELLQDSNGSNLENVKQGIVRAYNRWAFAREENFATVQDITKLTLLDDGPGKGQHVQVEWNDSLGKRVFREQGNADMMELLKQDPAGLAENDTEAAEVWINGESVGRLQGPDSIPTLQQALSNVTSRRLAYKRWQENKDSPGMIRMERYFGGYLRKKDDIFDHVMDNLIALEDVEMLDDQTLIGTATLCDWIMGGTLTSRLWVQEEADCIRFQRPLHNDDLGTSDRRFGLMRKNDPVKFALVQAELARLRYLATLTHPFAKQPSATSEEKKEDPMDEVRQRLGRNRSRRKVFGL